MKELISVFYFSDIHSKLTASNYSIASRVN